MKGKTEPRKATPRKRKTMPRKVQPPGISKPELVKRLAAHIGLPAETQEDWENCAVLRFGPPGVTLLTITIATNSLENVFGWYVSCIGGMPSDEQARIFRIHKHGEQPTESPDGK